MNFKQAALTAACTIAMAGPGMAATYTSQYSSFWVLGDSLSAFGPFAPGDPNNLRASDGPLWSEQIMLDFDPDPTVFEAGDKPTASYAAGSATAFGELLGQTTSLITEQFLSFGDRPLVSIWIGGNDAAQGAFQGSPVTEAFSSGLYGASLFALYGAGVRDFLLFEVPNVGITPQVQAVPQIDATRATEFAQNLNKSFFDDIIQGLQDLDPNDTLNVTIIETFDLTTDMIANPSVFGAERSGPCRIVVDGAAVQLDDCSKTAYWDGFHPTNVVHSFVADEVREALTPIPLPAAGWMLLASIAGLAALRRRKG